MQIHNQQIQRERTVGAGRDISIPEFSNLYDLLSFVDKEAERRMKAIGKKDNPQQSQIQSPPTIHAVNISRAKN